MPQPKKDAPDLIDLQNLTAQIGESYAHVVYFVSRVRADALEIIGKSVPAPYTPDTPPTHVALQRVPITAGRDLVVTMFTLAFDLWLQHDGGGATAAARGPTRDWQGRIEVPRRRRRP
jgi:hypothetical protein